MTHKYCLNLVFSAFLLFSSAGYAYAMPVEHLSVNNKEDTHFFTVELADTPEKQAKGLMFRKSLPKQHGMLFYFHEPRLVQMWMKNTPLSLDMAFINADANIVFIAADTTPFSLKGITTNQPVIAILEVEAGTFARLGIHVGDSVIHCTIEQTCD
jgi:uncharacterized membrane protein (UPF0127 family)